MATRPKGWTVLGSGTMADAVRGELERNPDLYAPETWSINPAGLCPCCGEHVFRCTTRHTGWSEGFATHANVVHPRCDPSTGMPDPAGAEPGCCCVDPNWGPMHSKKPRASRKRATRRRKAAR